MPDNTCNYVDKCVLILITDCFTRDPGISTIDGLFINPHDENRTHTFYFDFLPGSDDASIAQCQSLCSAEPQCFSYTFISNSIPNVTWMGECMGRSNEYDVSVPSVYATSGERYNCGESGKYMYNTITLTNMAILKVINLSIYIERPIKQTICWWQRIAILV